MNPLDLKKLITAFLLLATLVSSSALFLSSFQFTFSSPAQIFEDESVAGNGITDGANVFSEPLPEYAASTAGALPSGNPANLTDGLIQGFAEQLVTTNPSGPQLIGGDQPGVLLPDNKTIDQMIEKSVNAASARFSEFNIAIPDGDIRIKSGDATPEDIAAYASALEKALADTIAGESFENLADEEPSLAAVNATDVLVGGAIARLRSLTVPASLKELHKKSLVILFRYQKALDIIGGYQIDPIKTVAASQVLDQMIQNDLSALQLELQKISASAPAVSSLETNALVAFMERWFGVQTAHAVTSVPVDSPGPLAPVTFLDRLNKWLRILFEWARKIGTEVLKNQVIHRLVNQVITWVQGGGKPQFITNWRDFLRDVGNDAVGIAIQSIAPGICSPFAASVRLKLQPLINPVFAPPTCTLTQAVGNINAFHNDLRAGGWVGFASGIEPTSNIMGSLFDAQITLGQQRNQAEKSSDSEGQGGKGFLPTRICLQYMTGPLQPGQTRPCLEWENTTPGGVVGDVVKKAVADSPIDHLVNVQDLEKLAAAVVDSFLNKLIASGQNGLLGSSNRTGNPTPNSPSLCSGLTGQALLDCQGAVNSAPPPPQGLPPPPPIGTPTSTPPSFCSTTGNPPCSTVPPLDQYGNPNPLYQQCIAQCL